MDTRPAPAPPITILLADDEANLRMLVRTTLEHPSRRIVEAADGRSALDLVGRERPDVVVLDQMMPELTGLDVLRALRGGSATRSIPVVMLTASSQDKEKLEAERLGVDAYLVKPFSPLELLQAVEDLEGRDRDPDDATAAAPDADPRTARADDELLELPASQLALYARDLKQAVEAERARAAELSEANARLRILDRLKNDFLSFISHELRTPLNHMAAVDVFDPDADRRDQLEMIDLIRQGYERLETFVLRGLEYFEWLAGERASGDEDADVTMLVGRLAAEHPGLHEAGVKYTVELPPRSCRVAGRARDLGEVVRILIDNALKFSSRAKEVAIAVRAEEGRVRVVVRDRGDGFAPEMARELFRPFTVVDTLHRPDGTALSLALAAAIVEAFGGTIQAASDGPGRGATFTVELPEARVAGETLHATRAVG